MAAYYTIKIETIDDLSTELERWAKVTVGNGRDAKHVVCPEETAIDAACTLLRRIAGNLKFDGYECDEETKAEDRAKNKRRSDLAEQIAKARF